MAVQTIKCKVCGEEFVFTEGERGYFEANNLQTPKRCSKCRKAAKEARKIVNKNKEEK